MQKRVLHAVLVGLSILMLLVGLNGPVGPSAAVAADDKIQAEVLDQLDREGEVTFLVLLAEQADLGPAYSMRDWTKRGWFVLNTLREVAQRTQPAVRAALSSLRAAGHVSDTHPHYIVNLIVVTGDRQAARTIAALPEVAAVYPEVKIEVVEPVETGPAIAGPQAVEWNIQQIRADLVWSTYGVTGTGSVVANIDSGVEWDHPALIAQYRGNDGNHDYDWWDPTDQYDYPYPIGGSHGTHVMGTEVGDDGGTNQIGVAPGAQWIAAYGCCPDNEALLSATEWMIAPWQVNDFDPSHPTADPNMRPHAVNNSWGGPGGSLIFNQLMEAQQAAGIMVVHSAGNGGPQCGTLGSPGDNPAAFNVGATDSSDNIAGFSSRGPDPFTSWMGLYGVGPQVSAPGVSIRSSVPGGGYGSSSGTSMAAPHVAGAVGLLWSAEPDLIGRIEETEEILRRTAVPRTSAQECGGVPGSEIPNNTYGWGRLDIFAAVEMVWQAGTLAGAISDASTANPVENAVILAQRSGYTLTTSSDGAGDYGFLLGQGSYDVTVLAYGYQPWSQSGVNVTQDVTSTLDVALTPFPTHTLSGVVEEGMVQAVGDPLAAEVGVWDSPILLSTDPTTGAYSSPIAEGSHWMRVTAPGYLPENRSITANGDLVEDFILTPTHAYYFRDSRSPCGPTFNWIDATDGTSHNVNDGSFFPVTLPSPFTFYGTDYSVAFVSNDGFISFGQGFGNGHMVIPHEGRPNNAVYGLEEDLNPANGAQGIIYDKVVNNRYVVVEFYQVEHWESGFPETFEFILDLDTGTILIQYLDISWPDFTTVGIENVDGSDGLVYSYANSANITNSLAVGFYPVFGRLPADQGAPGILGTLSGTVYVSGTATPIPGALVTADSFLHAFSSTADANGEYTFADICADVYWLQAEAAGYYPSDVAEARLRWDGDVAVTDLWLEPMQAAPVLTKTVAQPQILPGEPVTYTLAYANDGDADLLDATLSDALPAEVAYITSTPPGVYQGGVLSWTVDISAGGAGAVTIIGLLSATAVPSTTVDNTAYLMGDGAVLSSTASFHVYLLPAVPLLTKTAALTEVLPGAMITYTLAYANEGGTDVPAAVLTDVLPAEVAYITSTPPGVYQGGVLSWTLDISAAGAGEVTVVGLLTVTAVPSTTVTNTAYLTWNSTSLSSAASFIVQEPGQPSYTIYLPLVLRNWP